MFFKLFRAVVQIKISIDSFHFKMQFFFLLHRTILIINNKLTYMIPWKSKAFNLSYYVMFMLYHLLTNYQMMKFSKLYKKYYRMIMLHLSIINKDIRCQSKIWWPKYLAVRRVAMICKTF